MQTFLLDTLALATVVTAVLVITARSPVVAVIYLIGVFVLAALYLVCLGVIFVGISYLVVYVGAVAVLFLFVVMMLNVRLSEVVSVGPEYTKGLPLGLFVGVLFLFELLSVMPAVSAQAGDITLDLLNLVHINLLNLDIIQSSVNYVNLAFSTPSADASFTSISQVQSLGLSLYTYGSLWLLITSIILLLAMIGPLSLCLRTRGS